MVALKIPATPEELSADWLTDALRSTGTIGGANVVSYESQRVGEGAGFIGQLALVTLRYDRPEEGAPASLIAKFPAVDPGGREIGNIFRFYEREARFYEQIAGEIDIRTPRCYYNGMDLTAGEFILLLEDLAPACVGDQLEGCTAAEMRLAVREVAKLHATWWDHPRLESLDWMPYINDRVNQSAEGAYQRALPAFVEFVKDKVPASIVALAEKQQHRVIASLDRMVTRPITIVHGDYRMDNLFFQTPQGGSPLAVIDWQIANRGVGVFDVAYLLSGNVDSRIRKAKERDVLKMYHDTLLAGGVKGYSFDKCWDDYRFCVLFCLVYNVIGMGTLDMANERGVAMWTSWLKRTAAAIEDLDAADLLPA